MNYKRKELGNVVLHTIKTDIFKTISVSIYFRREAKKEEITLLSLLFSLLTYSTSKYDYKSFIEKTEDLYNLKLKYSCNFESDKYRRDNLEINFLHPKYSYKEIEKDCLEFLNEMIFNPNFDNKDYFEENKQSVKTDILSIKNNKRKYAKQELLKNMEPDGILSFISNGYIEDLDDITIEKIKEIYLDIINNNQVDIFVVGDIDESFYEDYFNNVFKNNNRYEKVNLPLYIDIPKEKEIYVEDNSLNQSKLEIGLRVLNFDEKNEKSISNLYRIVLGVGPSSKLFKEVREKNSLAYYSRAAKVINTIMIIESGIDGINYNKTLELIKTLMKEMNNISNEELEIAKKSYISALKDTRYSMDSLINFYYKNELNKFPNYNLEDIINEVNNVKVEDINKFSNKVYIDTVLLYGVKHE